MASPLTAGQSRKFERDRRCRSAVLGVSRKNGACDMNRLLGLALICFLMPTSDRAAASDLFSVRCEGGAPVRPYFATFDIDAKAVVFETPPIDVETNFGINVHSGEIISTNDGKIEFILHVRPGRIDLIFDRNRKTMTWPGFDDPTFRPTLTHQCTVTPPRSILSFRVREPIQHPISVRCEDAGVHVFHDGCRFQTSTLRARRGSKRVFAVRSPMRARMRSCYR